VTVILLGDALTWLLLSQIHLVDVAICGFVYVFAFYQMWVVLAHLGELGSGPFTSIINRSHATHSPVPVEGDDGDDDDDDDDAAKEESNTMTATTISLATRTNGLN
jgi:hypothetical protein